MYVIVARTTVAEGSEDRAAAAIAAAVEPTRAESGNLSYFAHQGVDDPRVFLFYEKWVDEEAFSTHLASDHIGAMLAVTLSITETRQRDVLDLVGE